MAIDVLEQIHPHIKDSIYPLRTALPDWRMKEGDIPEGITINSPIIYKAKGCDKCNFIGYKRRTLISEILLIDEDIRDAIHKGATNKEIMAVAKRKGGMSLLDSGLKKVEEGITSLEEVMSVVII